jgi:hypothetical protein
MSRSGAIVYEGTPPVRDRGRVDAINTSRVCVGLFTYFFVLFRVVEFVEVPLRDGTCASDHVVDPPFVLAPRREPEHSAN